MPVPQAGKARARRHRATIGQGYGAGRPRDSYVAGGIAGLHLSPDRTYIANLEAGQRNPSLDLMARLPEALEVDLGELLSGLQDVRGRR
jgi:transcriptional regulator with XRE-family HTH domain